MGNLYNIICINCVSVLPLGKLYKYDENDREVPWKIGGKRDSGTNRWIEDEELLRLVERFLILHRGHELIFVPDSFLDQVDPDDKMQEMETVSQLMDQAIVPEPDPYKEAEEISAEVRNKIKDRLSRVEKTD